MKDALIEKLELLETPIGDIEIRGFDKPNGNFNQRDKNLLTNPEKVKRLRQSFDNTPFKFDLFFIDLAIPNYSRIDNHGEEGYGLGYEETLEKYAGKVMSPEEAFSEFEIKIKQDAISCIYLSNLTDTNNIPMTPWIVAHRFAHAILPDPFSGEILDDNVIGPLSVKFVDAIDKFEDFSQKYGNVKFTKFLTFRTARNDDLRIIGYKDNNRKFFEELQEELLSQFIINGKITFTIPKELKSDAYEIHEELTAIFKEMNMAAKNLLKASYGKLFIAP